MVPRRHETRGINHLGGAGGNRLGDAQTGAEIIALFARLNADGTTIVVVTHDEQMAAAARRVIHMRDGEVVRDEQNETPA